MYTLYYHSDNGFLNFYDLQEPEHYQNLIKVSINGILLQINKLLRYTDYT